jgi:hypothetical protein
MPQNLEISIPIKLDFSATIDSVLFKVDKAESFDSGYVMIIIEYYSAEFCSFLLFAFHCGNLKQK